MLTEFKPGYIYDTKKEELISAKICIVKQTGTIYEDLTIIINKKYNCWVKSWINDINFNYSKNEYSREILISTLDKFDIRISRSFIRSYGISENIELTINYDIMEVGNFGMKSKIRHKNIEEIIN